MTELFILLLLILIIIIVEFLKRKKIKYISKPIFILFPSHITSKNDGDKHYINFSRLIYLYGLKGERCLNGNNQHDLLGLNLNNVITLLPLYEGNYREVLQEKITEYYYRRNKR